MACSDADEIEEKKKANALMAGPGYPRGRSYHA
jgi:hypothetical protein